MENHRTCRGKDKTCVQMLVFVLAIQLLISYEVTLEPPVSPLNMTDNYYDYLLFLLGDCEILIKITLI